MTEEEITFRGRSSPFPRSERTEPHLRVESISSQSFYSLRRRLHHLPQKRLSNGTGKTLSDSSVSSFTLTAFPCKFLSCVILVLNPKSHGLLSRNLAFFPFIWVVTSFLSFFWIVSPLYFESKPHWVETSCSFESNESKPPFWVPSFFSQNLPISTASPSLILPRHDVRSHPRFSLSLFQNLKTNLPIC